ncbi:transglutaminase domain-containing protein [Tardisphaera miroshnichenkoae]
MSEYAAANLRGDCGVQVLLFIAMCRIAGIPAKWQSGLFVTPVRTGPHDWAQVYVDGSRIPVDPSFGGSRRDDEVLNGFYFGGLGAFRMIANEDFQVDFVPEKSYPRSDPIDNQRGEAETEDGNVYCDQFDSMIYVKEFRIT